jgi:membrane dipeptidase
MFKKSSGILILFLLSFQVSCAGTSNLTSDDDPLTRVMQILKEVPLIDGHNDVPWQYRGRANYKMSELDFMNTLDLDRPMHTDIPRLVEGGVGGQFWSVYVPAGMSEPQAVQATLEQVDFVYRMIDEFPDYLELALTADDIVRVHGEGKIASLIGMEGGHSIGNSLAVLRMFYDLGARYMTITHSRTLDWADASTDNPRHDGLSGFGEEVIREMNWLGMLVDLSHVSAQAMRDAINVSEAPVIFSHSSAFALTNHPRNVPDDVLHMVKENKGVVMVTYVPSFVSQEIRDNQAALAAERARLEVIYNGRPELISEHLNAWREANPAPDATLAQVADHIDHVKNLIGVDYVGIGADYDGISSLPIGLEDVTTYPDLLVELINRGWTDDEIKKLVGLNVLRVMREAEAVSKRLRSERGPSEAIISDFD